MFIRSQKDFYGGLTLAVVGAAFALGAREYPTGTTASMGPGYFPLILGVLLVVLSAAVTLRSFGKRDSAEDVGAVAWKPLAYVVAANFLFGILLEGLAPIGLPPMGLMPAIFALVLVASLAGSEFKLREALVLAVVLAAGSWLVFVKTINLPLQLWPIFFSG
jgi:hypothetical protein